MHIPDGFINGGTSAAGGAIAAGGVAVSLRRAADALDDKSAPLAGLVAAFIFAVQMLNFPVAIGHLRPPARRCARRRPGRAVGGSPVLVGGATGPGPRLRRRRPVRPRPEHRQHGHRRRRRRLRGVPRRPTRPAAATPRLGRRRLGHRRRLVQRHRRIAAGSPFEYAIGGTARHRSAPSPRRCSGCTCSSASARPSSPPDRRRRPLRASRPGLRCARPGRRSAPAPVA